MTYKAKFKFDALRNFANSIQDDNIFIEDTLTSFFKEKVVMVEYCLEKQEYTYSFESEEAITKLRMLL